MNKNNGFKVAALAASIALAMGSTAAMAAAPTATQLPGAGTVASGAATGGTITAGAQTITFTGNTVINWGKAGGTINATSQPAGFNIGSGASLGFTDSASAGSAVLNVDVSGNPSQIFGKLTMNAGGGNLYVANTNGIIVGATAKISGPAEIGLIANARGTVNFDGTAGPASIEYQGSGGDVSVAKGATIGGATVLVSGGGTVNVDLSAFTGGAATIQAGVKNSASTLVNDNTGAVLTAAGTLGGGATLASFASAGDASTSGTLALGGNARVDGTLTNTGALTLGTGFDIAGGLVNNKTVTQADDVSMGSLVNNLAYDGATFNLTTTDGGINNNSQMTNLGYVEVNGGDFVNNGAYASTGYLNVYGGGNVTNGGQATLFGVDIYEGGDFANSGTMKLTGDGVYVVNGSIANSGKLTVAGDVETASDLTAGNGFTAGADYSITNTGTITSAGDLNFGANSDWWNRDPSSKNDSTGSISNTGTLQVGAAGYLELDAYNDVNLAGTVQAFNGTKYAALSATNSLGGLGIGAGDYDGAVLNTDGVATVATDIVTGNGASIRGNQVKLMSNISAVDAAGDPANGIEVIAGAKSDTDYAVRVAAGKTILGDWIRIDGDQAGDESNVIVQGTLEANDIRFGSVSTVSDVFTGPAGSLSLFNNGADPYLEFDFSGAVKTVPYNNTPSNFRYNGLMVTTDGSPLSLLLDPVDYTTSGTATGSAVNILVNGDVNLESSATASVHGGGSAVTGVTNIPNTHLVLQSSGNIETGNGGDFYWPGYVYLGNVAADADGNALPGTLGLGTITTDGEFNNVLPGDVAGASGIHFITQFPMSLGGNVVTNANAWVNFGTDLLTQAYSTGTLSGSFFGGVAGVGKVVNYGPLNAANFVTQAPTDAK